MEQDLLYFLSDVRRCCKEHKISTQAPKFSYLNLFQKCFPQYTNQNEIEQKLNNLEEQGKLINSMDVSFFKVLRNNLLDEYAYNVFYVNE